MLFSNTTVLYCDRNFCKHLYHVFKLLHQNPLFFVQQTTFTFTQNSKRTSKLSYQKNPVKTRACAKFCIQRNEVKSFCVPCHNHLSILFLFCLLFLRPNVHSPKRNDLLMKSEMFFPLSGTLRVTNGCSILWRANSSKPPIAFVDFPPEIQLTFHCFLLFAFLEKEFGFL